ncbi:MAG: InlB B-repeat-containing protein [Oscillospiraceae bacterium]|nr:InlB B-repeat-containing protein [Oscillospiraceae bacterium]
MKKANTGRRFLAVVLAAVMAFGGLAAGTVGASALVASATIYAVGETITVTCDESGQIEYVAFTPTTDGVYVFQSRYGTYSGSEYPFTYGYIYSETGASLREYDLNITIPSRTTAYLEAGKTYLYGAKFYYSGMTGTIQVTVVQPDVLVISPQAVTIYAMDSEYDDLLTIPTELPQTAQITIENQGQGTTLKSGSSAVKLSQTGEVTVVPTIFSLNAGHTVYDFGIHNVIVTAGTKTALLTVNIVDYSELYIDQELDRIAAEIMAAHASDYDRVDAVCRWIASFDYSGYYSWAGGYILFDGGDCWASTDAILRLAERFGLRAHSRSANLDSGAGSGHYHAIVEINGVPYIAEAGYSGNAPRSYSLTAYPSGFMTKADGANVKIHSYLGFGTAVTVPAQIDGKTVTSIEQFAFCDGIAETIVLSNGIQTIEANAFSWDSKLKSVTIPASVTNIAATAFNGLNGVVIIGEVGSAAQAFALAHDMTFIPFGAAQYAVTYNANGGSGAPAAQTKIEGVTLKLSATVPTWANHTFKGWAASSTATTAQYQPGGDYTADVAATLYAVWEEDAPTAYALTVTNGTGSGSYAAGAVVSITANTAPTGKVFDKWTTTSGTIANASSASTTFTMPAGAATVTATYKDAPPATYALTVTNGTGSGSYAAGAVVSITANTAPTGKVFDKWTTTSGTIANASSASTTFTMPAGAATVTATYKDAPPEPDTKKYITVAGKATKYEDTPLNWFLFIVCFGWIWMWF